MSLLQLMVQPEMREGIKAAITHNLEGMNIACYYGCALVRPTGVCDFDDPENPQSMDELLALTGAECVDWGFKTECCGASYQIISPADARQLIENIMQDAAAHGANAIAMACPLCMVNLDLREREINAHRSEPFDLPCYFFTELLGMAMGGSPEALGITKHFWPAADLVQRHCAPRPPEPAANAAGDEPAAPAPAATPKPAAPAAPTAKEEVAQ
jgi:heterodisulfide reductase subunit B